MKVFVVIISDHDWQKIVGVYDSREKAERIIVMAKQRRAVMAADLRARGLRYFDDNDEHKEWTDVSYMSGAEIEEHEVR